MKQEVTLSLPKSRQQGGTEGFVGAARVLRDEEGFPHLTRTGFLPEKHPRAPRHLTHVGLAKCWDYSVVLAARRHCQLRERNDRRVTSIVATYHYPLAGTLQRIGSRRVIMLRAARLHGLHPFSQGPGHEVLGGFVLAESRDPPL